MPSTSCPSEALAQLIRMWLFWGDEIKKTSPLAKEMCRLRETSRIFLRSNFLGRSIQTMNPPSGRVNLVPSGKDVSRAL